METATDQFLGHQFLCALQMPSHRILATTLWGGYCHYTHFTDKKTEAQRGGLTCLTSHGCQTNPLERGGHQGSGFYWRLRPAIYFVPSDKFQKENHLHNDV